LLSFGGETFLYSPFYMLVPGFSIFRGQERAAFIVSFALAVLAGYGFKYQVSNMISQTSGAKSHMTSFKSAVGWLLIGAIGLDVLFFYGLNSTGWQDDSPFNSLLKQSIWLTIVLALIWTALQIAGHLRQRAVVDSSREKAPGLIPASHTFLAISYLLVATLDLFTVNWKTNIYPAPPEAQTAVPEVVQVIREDASPGEVFRVYNEYRVYDNYGVPYQLEDAWGASPLRLARYDEMYRSLRMERVWELLNVKYVITWREELYAPSEIIYQEPAGDDVTYVHRLEEVVPRAWLVYQVEEVDEGETLARLDAFEFDLTQVAVVPPGTSLPLEGAPNAEIGQVEIVGRTSNSMDLDVTTPSNGLLVLSEIYFPSWQATVDGQTARMLRANHILRGLPVPAGQHRVTLRFLPATLVWGAVISGITLAAMTLVAFWAWRRRKSL